MIIDSHCHLHDPAFRDLREMLVQALAHDVWGVVAVGCDADTNARTLAAAGAAPKSVWACLGFHPEWTHLGEGDLDRVEQQLAENHHRIVGLGEVGLPWYSLAEAPDPGALDALRALGVDRAVFHWHKSSAEVTRAIVDAGYFISVTPEVVYRERDRELVERVPIESLLVETDSPWRYRGEFEGLAPGPWFAARVAEEIAKIKRLPVDDVMHTLSTNTSSLFHLMWQ